MVLLNLTDFSKSDLIYKIDRFPDGQIGFRIIGLKPPFANATMDEVMITSRLTWNDVQVLLAAVPALRGMGITKIDLFIPYFLGARSDRTFEKGGVNYVKDVMAPLINSLKLDKVSVYDPHSDVVEACLNNFDKVTNESLIGHSLHDSGLFSGGWNWIVPDAGAAKKAYDSVYAKRAKQVVVCGKHRDIPTGKIVGTYVPSDDLGGLPCVIIDDICDGGRTFIELAKELKERHVGDLYLIVSHGIFSAGFTELQKYFKRIYCTDSYQTVVTDFVKQPIKWFS